MPLIKPTVGRVLWYWPDSLGRSSSRISNDQPFKADVIYVWNDREVNLQIVTHTGITFSLKNVILVQDEDPVPCEGGYASWMPYQLERMRQDDRKSWSKPSVEEST